MNRDIGKAKELTHKSWKIGDSSDNIEILDKEQDMCITITRTHFVPYLNYAKEYEIKIPRKLLPDLIKVLDNGVR